MKRLSLAICSLAGSIALLGAALPSQTTTTVETAASAAVDFPPDRLFVAVDVELEAGSPGAIGTKALDAATARIVAAGIPAGAVLKRFVTSPDPKWKRFASDLDERPYGVILLQFPNPARSQLVTLTEKTLTAAFERPLDENTFAEVGGAWYGLDDCRRLRIAARKGALALARERGERLARAAGLTLDASGGIRAAAAVESAGAETEESELSYVCGRTGLPDIPPPQLRAPNTASDRSGFVEDESTITVDWPTLPLAMWRPAPIPRTLTSLGSTADDVEETPGVLAPGTVRAVVAVSSADIAAGSGCAYDAALATASALAAQRAAFAGRLVGLVPDRPLAITDIRTYHSVCPGRAPTEPAVTARIAASFAAVSAPHGHGIDSHVEASGTTSVRAPADRARVLASVVPGAQADLADAPKRLAQAGLQNPSVQAVAGAPWRIDGSVAHPTAATMAAIDAAITALGATGATPARTFAYAVDDCSALNERALRGAVEAAENAGRAAARSRGLHPRGISAIEAGPIRVHNCGPRVLDKLQLELPANAATESPATDPSVSADASVRLQYVL